MKIILLSYGVLRDFIGSRLVLEVECREQNTCRVADLLKTLIARYPAAKAHLEKSVIVRSDKALKDSDEISEGDIIVLLPPGSGG